jgi:hypothetical protein
MGNAPVHIERDCNFFIAASDKAKFLISSSVDVLLKSILRDPSGTSWNFLRAARRGGGFLCRRVNFIAARLTRL